MLKYLNMFNGIFCGIGIFVSVVKCLVYRCYGCMIVDVLAFMLWLGSFSPPASKWALLGASIVVVFMRFWLHFCQGLICIWRILLHVFLTLNR